MPCNWVSPPVRKLHARDQPLETPSSFAEQAHHWKVRAKRLWFSYVKQTNWKKGLTLFSSGNVRLRVRLPCVLWCLCLVLVELGCMRCWNPELVIALRWNWVSFELGVIWVRQEVMVVVKLLCSNLDILVFTRRRSSVEKSTPQEPFAPHLPQSLALGSEPPGEVSLEQQQQLRLLQELNAEEQATTGWVEEQPLQWRRRKSKKNQRSNVLLFA